MDGWMEEQTDRQRYRKTNLYDDTEAWLTHHH